MVRVDLLVPFALNIDIVVFEALVLALGVLSVLVTWYATRDLREKSKNKTALT